MAISKIDGVQRIVDSAIRQLFQNEDPLAIQLLAASAYRVARDLADLDGNVRIRKEEREFIDPGSEREFYNALMEVSNFLKHAEKDPHGVLADFDARRNDLDLFSCTFYLSAFGKALSPERLAFLQWGAIVYPELFRNAASFKRTTLAKEYPDLKSADRQEQLAVGNRILGLNREALAAA